MTLTQYKAKMLVLSTQQAELLCELTALEEIKIEPEQVRKNVTAILSLMTETEDFIKSLFQNACSSSEESISD